MTIELTKEEIETERQRKARIRERREKFILNGLHEFANLKPGVNRSLFYAREGQYGKDDKVLVWFDRDKSKVGWIDPTESTMYGLAIFNSKLDLVVEITRLSANPESYVIFKKTFMPKWETKHEEVALIYDKGIK